MTDGCGRSVPPPNADMGGPHPATDVFRPPPSGQTAEEHSCVQH